MTNKALFEGEADSTKPNFRRLAFGDDLLLLSGNHTKLNFPRIRDWQMPSVAIRPTRSLVPLLLHILDSVLLCVSLPLVQWITGNQINQSTMTASLIACIVWFVIGEMCGYYRPSRGRSANTELAIGTIGWTITFMLMMLIGIFTKQIDTFARSSIFLWYFIGGLFVVCNHMGVRAAFEYLNRLGVGVRKTAIVGANRLGYDIASNAMRATDSGMRIVGFFDDRGDERRETTLKGFPPFMGTTEDLYAEVNKGEIDVILIALPMRAERRIQAMLDRFANSTASVYIVPDFFVFELLHSRWTQIGGLPVVSVFETPMYGVDGWIKRGLDLALSLVGIILISPLLIACALAVKFTSPGPIFFRQKRYGLDGKEILVWKFRSMVTCDNGPVVKQATKGDPRITPVGAFLRRTSLDELPQLINVIEGSMSLVGPRPHANAHNEHYRKLIRGYMMRHKVKPGITGLAQVMGFRGETDTTEKMEARIELDHRYIREWSVWLDIKLLFKTFGVVFKQEAY